MLWVLPEDVGDFTSEIGGLNQQQVIIRIYIYIYYIERESVYIYIFIYIYIHTYIYIYMVNLTDNVLKTND